MSHESCVVASCPAVAGGPGLSEFSLKGQKRALHHLQPLTDRNQGLKVGSTCNSHCGLYSLKATEAASIIFLGAGELDLLIILGCVNRNTTPKS